MPIKASTINGMARSAENLSRRTLNPYYLEQPKIRARLIGSSSPYSFREVHGASVSPATGIVWADVTGGYSGTNNATEVNAQAGLDGKIAELDWTDDEGQYRFVYPRKGKAADICCIIPGCPCALSPRHIQMTSSKPLSNNQIFQSALLEYGPTPSALLPVVLVPNSYLSTTSFFDPILSVPFFYFFTCSIGAYVLTRVYVASPFGSPFRDSIRYKWVPGFPGNTCTPFIMVIGQIFAGGDASCVVTLHFAAD